MTVAEVILSILVILIFLHDRFESLALRKMGDVIREIKSNNPDMEDEIAGYMKKACTLHLGNARK